jgi:hypothetical protein
MDAHTYIKTADGKAAADALAVALLAAKAADDNAVARRQNKPG